MRRVLIVDESELFRRSLRAILQTCAGWEICAEAENAHEGARFAEEVNPDAVLMDISMPGLSGTLSLHESKQLVENVLELGAAGYAVKPRADSDLIDALNAVIRDHRFETTSSFSCLVVAEAGPQWTVQGLQNQGTLETRPVTATTSKLVCTLFFDNSILPDDAARDAQPSPTSIAA